MNHDMEMETMPMHFVWGYETTILFKSWHTKTAWEFYTSCLAIIALCILTQAVRAKLPPAGYHFRRLEEHFAYTVLYGITAMLSFLLMLIVMTYNIGLFLSVIIGLTIGYHYSSVNLPHPCDEATF
ncbi:Copper transport protein CTR2 [Diplonema papillatum]|nr:Copper transport protein CTR2 [Diplonema papillatum]|eukprot:gene12783-19724_t